jgi:hypothetical protein
MILVSFSSYVRGTGAIQLWLPQQGRKAGVVWSDWTVGQGAACGMWCAATRPGGGCCLRLTAYKEAQVRACGGFGSLSATCLTVNVRGTRATRFLAAVAGQNE